MMQEADFGVWKTGMSLPAMWLVFDLFFSPAGSADERGKKFHEDLEGLFSFSSSTYSRFC